MGSGLSWGLPFMLGTHGRLGTLFHSELWVIAAPSRCHLSSSTLGSSCLWMPGHRVLGGGTYPEDQFSLTIWHENFCSFLTRVCLNTHGMPSSTLLTTLRQIQVLKLAFRVLLRKLLNFPGLLFCPL